MAGPTPDSANAPDLSVPPAGPGSKTPMNPASGTPTPIGGGKPPAPAGMPGKPPAAPEMESPEEKLDKDTVELLLENIDDLINTGTKETEEIVDRLLVDGWSEDRFKSVARLFKKETSEFITETISLVKNKGLEGASEILKEKFNEADIDRDGKLTHDEYHNLLGHGSS